MEARWDPHYSKKYFTDLRRELNKIPNIRKVGELIVSCTRGDGPRDGFYTDDQNEGVYFLRINNLKDHTIDLTDVKLIYRHVHEKTLKRTKVRSGDIVFAISGTKDNLGTVSIIPEDIVEANLNSAILKIVVNEVLVVKEFFTYFFDLKIADKQIDMIGKGAAQNNLNSQEMFSIKIPLPTIERQREVVSFLEMAKIQKRQQESDAQALLDSIDSYLLGELGITLPIEPANTIENRIFCVAREQVSGGRFDPTFQKVVTEFVSSAYSSALLREYVHINPLTSFKELTDEDEVSFVPMESVSEDGHINLSSTRILADSKGYTTFAENDLLVAKITPCMENGKSGVARNLINGYGFGSTEYHVFRSKSEKLNIDFLHAFFHAEFFRKNAKMMFGGSAGHQRVPPEFFKRLRIPVPPLDVQERIVAHIDEVRRQAFALRQQAGQDFAAAKAEIERMILG